MDKRYTDYQNILLGMLGDVRLSIGSLKTLGIKDSDETKLVVSMVTILHSLFYMKNTIKEELEKISE